MHDGIVQALAAHYHIGAMHPFWPWEMVNQPSNYYYESVSVGNEIGGTRSLICRPQQADPYAQ